MDDDTIYCYYLTKKQAEQLLKMVQNANFKGENAEEVWKLQEALKKGKKNA